MKLIMLMLKNKGEQNELKARTDSGMRLILLTVTGYLVSPRERWKGFREYSLVSFVHVAPVTELTLLMVSVSVSVVQSSPLRMTG